MHMAKLMPLPLAVSCFRKSRLVLVPAHPGNTRQSPKGRKTCVCMYVCVWLHDASIPQHKNKASLLFVLLSVPHLVILKISHDCKATAATGW